ncbi:leukocyte immunoglobulin-like receptor subfamily A member 6 [Rousettus aegyptiacus]|uniref:leukocyte immunoglobulin-like receptor subfamily A member 6 n=1 Tax=Rousettus aegyptiacus TaxID=9407 RepID=UPI00168D8CA8|nr:leukocyte immunoglobulin-like receptor subfamily A member 6 [Rousettus aegyptiacus]
MVKEKLQAHCLLGSKCGNLSRPVVTALPGFMVQYKNPVTILCQGPAQAEAYKIYKVGSLKSRDRLKSLVPRKDNSLTITEITADCTGLYQCSYHSSGLLSELSDPLQLVMIGVYDKPSLSSLASGDNVKLQHFSRFKFNVFFLIKEDGVHAIQKQHLTSQGNGLQVAFHMDHVTSTQTGTYRCYGAFHNYLYVWSHPSDRLHLLVKGEEAHPTPCPSCG